MAFRDTTSERISAKEQESASSDKERVNIDQESTSSDEERVNIDQMLAEDAWRRKVRDLQRQNAAWKDQMTRYVCQHEKTEDTLERQAEDLKRQAKKIKDLNREKAILRSRLEAIMEISERQATELKQQSKKLEDQKPPAAKSKPEDERHNHMWSVEPEPAVHYGLDNISAWDDLEQELVELLKGKEEFVQSQEAMLPYAKATATSQPSTDTCQSSEASLPEKDQHLPGPINLEGCTVRDVKPVCEMDRPLSLTLSSIYNHLEKLQVVESNATALMEHKDKERRGKVVRDEQMGVHESSQELLSEFEERLRRFIESYFA